MVLSTDQSPYEVSCQTEAEALRIAAHELRTAFRASEPLRGTLLRHGAVVFATAGRSLARKATHNGERRLARWLLMCRDRTVGDQLPFTQDALARALGVQRPAASLAAEALRERGAIDYHRGQIAITNRTALEAASCEDYRAYREAYEQLLGPMPSAA